MVTAPIKSEVRTMRMKILMRGEEHEGKKGVSEDETKAKSESNPFSSSPRKESWVVCTHSLTSLFSHATPDHFTSFPSTFVVPHEHVQQLFPALLDSPH